MEYTEKIYFQFEKDLLSTSTKDREEILTYFDGKLLYLTYRRYFENNNFSLFSLGSSDLYDMDIYIALNDPEFDLIFYTSQSKNHRKLRILKSSI